MSRFSTIRIVSAFLFLSLLPVKSFAEDPALKKIQERLDRLEKRQSDLEEQLKEKDARIKELETELDRAKQEKKEAPVPPVAPKPETGVETAVMPKPETGVETATALPVELRSSPKPYEPGKGFNVFTSKWGEMNVGIYSYARYLNQKAIDDIYIDSFGRPFTLDPRHDVQLGKLQFKFNGWLGTPKFRYYLWAWTSNANMGQGAQVVLAGTLSYLLNKHFSVGAGITALPTTRSTRGNFPYWSRVDARPFADEYFRGSYTTGFYAWGDIIDNLHYKTMIGNNLSQLGIDAGQLDNAFQTLSTALWWTTDNYGTYEGYGDFDHHENVALTFGGAYSRSRESRQSQPGKEDPENTQIRVSDGTAIFDIGSFGPGLQIEEATYQMSAFDGGIKYRGFSFDFNYYLRWVNDLASQQTLPVKSFFDHGFDVQASYMLVPRRLQIYGFGSKIFGQFGDPYEVGGGFNVFPFKNKSLRFNVELDYAHRSPVGYLAYPLQVGANGPIFMGNLELNL